MKRTALYMLFSLIIIALFACNNTDTNESNSESIEIEGMELSVDIIENLEDGNKSVVEITVNNESEKTFVGTVSTWIGLQNWEIEIESLPAEAEMTRQVMGTYIKHPDDGYKYEFEGEFVDSAHTTEVDYELHETESINSFDVKMNEINKENVIEVMKDLYSKYGSEINHVGFYDMDVDLENMDYDKDFPKAEYYGSTVSKEIIIGDEKFNFEPQNNN